MNKHLLLSAVVYGALCLAFTIRATADDSVSPRPPFLQLPPEWASWGMTVVPKQDGDSKNPAHKEQQLVKMQVTQTGKIKQEISTWSDGQTSEAWTINGKKLVENSKDHALILIDPAHNQSAGYYMRYDLALLSWVSLSTYVHAETHANHHCYLYKNAASTSPASKPADGRFANEDAGSSEGFAAPSVQVWIDVETHQVVSVDDGAMTYDFAFGPPPSAELVLPPKFASLWQSYQDAMNPLKNQLAPIH